jgi:hypothetical protein
LVDFGVCLQWSSVGCWCWRRRRYPCDLATLDLTSKESRRTLGRGELEGKIVVRNRETISWLLGNGSCDSMQLRRGGGGGGGGGAAAAAAEIVDLLEGLLSIMCCKQGWLS